MGSSLGGGGGGGGGGKPECTWHVCGWCGGILEKEGRDSTLISVEMTKCVAEAMVFQDLAIFKSESVVHNVQMIKEIIII